jgi:hypothetical protein
MCRAGIQRICLYVEEADDTQAFAGVPCRACVSNKDSALIKNWNNMK